MSHWSEGYVTEIDYTYGYFHELNPLRLRLAFANAGLVCPPAGTACELGFGQGMSANIHAAASMTQWFGTDFSPSQTAFAQELAQAAGAGARLYDQSFAEFAARTDLPDFDFIGLHGIWSWITEESRANIIDFVRRKLKVGGVLYMGYNTQPGWARLAPVRHLFSEFSQSQGQGGVVQRIDGALAFAKKLMATNPAYGNAHPGLAEQISKLGEQNRHYLAHEYFNQNWHPMYFATSAKYLENAKLTYACSAHMADHVDALNITTEHKAILDEIGDPVFRETVRDFILNQRFRRDYWVKGARKLPPIERTEALRAIKVVLACARVDVVLTANGALGEAPLNEAVYDPILDALADHKPRTLGQLELMLQSKGIGLAHLLQAALILASTGNIALAQEDAQIAKVRKHTDKLNASIINKARAGAVDICHLASPVTGGGVFVARFGQLFLLAISQGLRTPEQWAQATWAIMSQQGQKLVQKNKRLETAEENIAELTAQAKVFAASQLPMLKQLQVI